MDRERLQSKFAGSMLGTAVGDGLGAGFEGLPNVNGAQIDAVAERRKVLRYTDDTHMMIGVAESLINMEGFDGRHMADMFCRNYNRQPFRGYGPGPPRIFASIERGTPWDTASEQIYPGGSWGNGAAMRIAPVGLAYHSDFGSLKEIAFDSARITHAHILGKEGAALQALAVALATRMDSTTRLDTNGFLSQLHSFAAEAVYKDKLSAMPELLNHCEKTRVVQQLGNGIEAFTAVPAAIFSFLAYPDSFENAVIFAISLGGDTDTIGAMTGAISGAYLGVEAIPTKWLAKLENRKYIEALATELFNLKREGQV